MSRLLDVLKKGYHWKTFWSDLSAGLIVGVVAIPLAVAFAIASGVTPDKGLLTAVVAGFLVSVLGGSNVQIGGPTGAFIVIIAGVLSKFGPDGLILATLMAGAILVILGYARLGTVIQFVPYPVIVGFTTGIALIILSSQVNDFLGLGLAKVPADFIEKWTLFISNLGRIHLEAVALSVGSIITIVAFARWDRRIPGALVALVLGTGAVFLFHLPVETIGSRFGEISGSVSFWNWPLVSVARLGELVMPAVSIAMLAGIESLLSAMVADGMTGDKHNPHQELVGQGFANLASALLGGLPATGAIARTATNIRSGAKTPVAGVVHAVFLLLVLLFLSPWAAHIPLAALAGILATVSYNMSEWKTFRLLLKGPTGDMLVLVSTFLLTVLVDLTFAIPVGILIALLFFLRKMSQTTQVTVHHGELRDAPEELDPFGLTRVTLPPEVEVFEIEGPFFFGASERFKEVLALDVESPRVRILRFRRVPSIDASGVMVLKSLLADVLKQNKFLLFASVSAEVRQTLNKAGFTSHLGAENFVPNLVTALDRAAILMGRADHSLPQRLRHGGTRQHLAANTPVQALEMASEGFPLGIADRQNLLRSMVEREAMASTALGRAIAFPHPRDPLSGHAEQEFVMVAYLESPIDWGAADGAPVTVLFLMASASVASHLKTLAALAKVTKQPDFRALLDQRADALALASWIEEHP